MTKSNFIVTGTSGVGKTTLLTQFVRHHEHVRIRGFLSPEIREGGQRVGWSLQEISGACHCLAHHNMESEIRMGQCGLDLRVFEQVCLRQLTLDRRTELYVIDEIGIISSKTPSFRPLLQTLLDAGTPLLAIARRKGEALLRELQARDDVEFLELQPGQYTGAYERLAAWWSKVSCTD